MRRLQKMTRTYEKEESGFPIWDCGSPLYDSYELVSLTHLIERHMMALPSPGGSRQINREFCDAADLRSSGKAGGSSVANRVGGFLVNWVWKRKRKKEKHRKVRTGFSGICDTIAWWKK
ncbi:uncharacterized protein LOC129301528 [Prosopis cineraria]|uniref:uncharacterized protein LOC129301528 n=1 Tax=Prosopis cineraria TaxID=364024 RepID=UPI002410479C|nr:uncharacterized protein LOC129301528 [Prosopis cineraria]